MKYILLIIFLFFNIILYAQSPGDYDISLEGFWVGDNNSAASYHANNIQIKVLSRPLNQGKNGVLLINSRYDYIKVRFNDNEELFANLEHFHSAKLMFGYMKQLTNPKWNFIGTVIPQLNSNFTNGISSDDLYCDIILMLNYLRSKNTRFTMGVAYINSRGFPFPIPVFNYWKAWNNKWEMNFGFPRINFTHHFNNQNSVTALAELKGYNGNISEDINNSVLYKGRRAQCVNYRNVLSGLEWRHELKKIRFRINAGYTINREFKLQNTNNDTAYKFDMDNNFNLGVGIDVNIH